MIRARALAALTALCLVAACGTELSDAERAGYLGATGVAAGEAAAGAAGGASRASAATGAPGASAAGGMAAPSGAVGMAGAPSDAGTGGTPVEPAATDVPCAAPSSEVGVSDTEITLGGVFQLSGPVTGFAEQFLAGVNARLVKQNAAGGICGRQLRYLSRDDGFDAARNASETQSLVGSALALVGSFSTVDAGGANVLDGTNVPDITVAASARRDQLPNHRAHLYFPASTEATAEYRYFADQGARTAVLVYVSLAAARDLADINEARMSNAGLQVVDRIELAPTQFSYDGVAREIANSGADVMFFLHEVNASVAMAQALAEVDHGLEFPVFSAFSYSPRFLELAGASAEGLNLLVPFQPFEEVAANPALGDFVGWLQQVSPGAGPTYDALNGWAVTSFFLEALEQLPGPITRDAVLESVGTIADFDADGAWAPTRPNERQAPPCQVLLRAQGGVWVREAPAEGFLC